MKVEASGGGGTTDTHHRVRPGKNILSAEEQEDFFLQVNQPVGPHCVLPLTRGFKLPCP